MSDSLPIIDLLQKRAIRRDERRHFFRKTGGIAAGLAIGTVLGACNDSGDVAVAQSTAGRPDR